MHGKRFVLWTVLCVAALAVVWYRSRVNAKPAPQPTPELIMLVRDSGPFWQLCVNGAEAAARDQGVDLRMERYEGLDEQMTILTRIDFSTLGNDGGLAISPLDAEGQTHLINRIARETNVITFDSDAPLSERQGHVGTSNFAAGMLCGQLVKEVLPEGGKVAVLVSNRTKANLIDRVNGLKEQLVGPTLIDTEKHSPDDVVAEAAKDDDSPKYEIVGYFVDEGRNVTPDAAVRQALQAHPEVDCVVGLNARHGPVLMRVLAGMDRLGTIKLVTFDEAPETLDGVEAGHIHATVAQDPFKFGYEAVTMLNSLCRGEPEYLPISGRGSLLVQPEAVRSDNLADFRARLKLRQQPSKQRVETTPPVQQAT